MRMAEFWAEHRDLLPPSLAEIHLDTMMRPEKISADTLAKERENYVRLRGLSKDAAKSNLYVSPMRKPHPFDMKAVTNFKNVNSHHSRCIEAKVACTVGLGHVDESVYDVLNPLSTDDDWHSIQVRAGEDFSQSGNGYIEAVREDPDGDNSPISGLHFMQGPEVRVWIEDQEYHTHYDVISNEGGSEQRFAKFGDLAAARARLGDKNMRSELIRIPRPSSLSRWYGFPDWLSAVSSVEIVAMLDQHVFDYFLNRCVPEFILFVLGKKVGDPDWTRLNSIFKKHIGQGASRKSSAFNFDDPAIKVQLEKLGVSEKSDTMFIDFNDALAYRIVTAHGVPPLLAGIQVPGKLGATNEFPNALMAFQALVVGQIQRLWENRLDMTLGNPEKNGGLKFKKVRGRPSSQVARGTFNYKQPVEEIMTALLASVGQQTGESAAPGANPMDTVSRMRTNAPVAAANGRDLNGGVKH